MFCGLSLIGIEAVPVPAALSSAGEVAEISHGIFRMPCFKVSWLTLYSNRDIFIRGQVTMTA